MAFSGIKWEVSDIRGSAGSLSHGVVLRGPRRPLYTSPHHAIRIILGFIFIRIWRERIIHATYHRWPAFGSSIKYQYSSQDTEKCDSWLLSLAQPQAEEANQLAGKGQDTEKCAIRHYFQSYQQSTPRPRIRTLAPQSRRCDDLRRIHVLIGASLLQTM
ncbi:uncharacterized protein APUU_50960A [Aspergillus puulaauensis]|uniref:Uncharacterized protein n=1 Tax=Aspergillus puulaauensis TaxID=1220207 RepID=A0A7R7XT09_9EURO|nr:uncharacterized protein APUU_50960A [Aspergillus puulaauensis]BCS26249.1 hypothetical protein APUU_50960A [Aspergillus puulaauensis]